MNIFRIEVIFRKYTNFTRHNTGINSEISGVIELVTDRCDIEPILSDYNVALYKIIDCDYKAQIMSGFRKIPSHEGVNVDGMTIYPMIRASNIKDFDYEPYVPSVLDHIKKLEDRVAVLEGSAPASILDVNSLDSNAFKIQNIDGENDLTVSL